WLEAFVFAVGVVNKDRSPDASNLAIRVVRARRQAILEFLKSWDVEKREPGERIDRVCRGVGSVGIGVLGGGGGVGG
ncbi:hypothetical protein ACQWF0_26455, partial [Salmonella enterica subsp. enterica serovar Infantis]